MHVVILGAGSVGFQLAKQLIEEHKNVVLIEKDPEKAKYAATLLDCMVINEVGTNLDTLRKGGIQKADYFISVTDSDEMNMIACGMVSGESKVPYKIARVRNIDYTGASMLEEPFMGIDYIVNPEIEVARAIADVVERGAVSDIMFFEKTGLQMRSITVNAGSPFNNKSIEEIKKVIRISFLVAAILRNNGYIIPSGDIRIMENDKLYLIATESDFEGIFAQIGKNRMSLNKIVIVGGSRIGQYVVEDLLQRQKRRFPFFSRLMRSFKPIGKRKITIIDSNYENCKFLADRFPEALIIHADLSDEKFSEEEQFSDADLVIATTDNQELNIVNAIYAKTLGTRRTIALVNKSNYLHIASNLGIDVTISPIDSMVNTILKHISKGNIQSVHSISGGKIEVIELTVAESSKMAGKKIRDTRLALSSLIISVTRNGKDIIPTGEIMIQQGDHLIIIARKDAVPKLEEIFTG